MHLTAKIKFHGSNALFTGLSLVSITINKIIKIVNKKEDREEQRKGREAGRGGRKGRKARKNGKEKGKSNRILFLTTLKILKYMNSGTRI